MKATEFIKISLESSMGWTMGLIEDMKDAPLTQPTARGGNHPLWVLGHIIYSESTLLDEFILGKENRYPEWKTLFGMGGKPTSEASDYPSMDELIVKLGEMRAATLAYLDTLSDDDLDRRSFAPEEFGPTFGSVGAVFSAMPTHMSFHAGQVADARRAAGREPLMT